MGFGSFIKKVGRAVDPTSSKSALGGVVRSAASFVPGGAAALGAVDTFNAARRSTTRSTPTDRGGGAAAPALTTTSALPAPPTSKAGFARFLDVVKGPTGLVIAGATALVVVLVVVLRGRK